MEIGDIANINENADDIILLSVDDTLVALFVNVMAGVTNSVADSSWIFITDKNISAYRNTVFADSTGIDDENNVFAYDQLSNRNQKAVVKYINACLERENASGSLNKYDLQQINSAFEEANISVNANIVASVYSDTQANVLEALTILKPFTSPLNTVFGIIAILISLLLTVQSLYELCLLNFFNGTLADILNKSNGKPVFFSHALLKAAKDESGDTSRNIIYVGNRVFQIIIIIICLLYLINGQIAQLLVKILEFIGL
jgi:hypothetical protein